MKKEHRVFDVVIVYTAHILTVSLLIRRLFSSFSDASSREIKRFARGTCQNCGKHVGENNLIAAHYNHDKSKRSYDSPENGRALCAQCEARYHITSVGNAKCIGMSERDNLTVAWGHFWNLDADERDEVLHLFPTQMAVLYAAMDR